MPYRIAGIDVHKKMLAVVVADVEVEGEYRFDRRKVGTSPADLRALANWLRRARGRRGRHGIDCAVLASGLGGPRAALAAEAPDARGREPDLGTLHLAQAQSNRGAGAARKTLRMRNV